MVSSNTGLTENPEHGDHFAGESDRQLFGAAKHEEEPADVPGEEALECVVIAQPGEDADGRNPTWKLEAGVPGHWSSGWDIPVPATLE
jgi:hypothetical protein